MSLNLGSWGLILNIIGVLIITFTEIVNPRYIKDYSQPFRKRYWFKGWRPFYKNTQTKKWVIKLDHKPTVGGMIPPKYKYEFIGLILILIGFALQISFNLYN